MSRCGAGSRLGGSALFLMALLGCERRPEILAHLAPRLRAFAFGDAGGVAVGDNGTIARYHTGTIPNWRLETSSPLASDLRAAAIFPGRDRSVWVFGDRGAVAFSNETGVWSTDGPPGGGGTVPFSQAVALDDGLGIALGRTTTNGSGLWSYRGSPISEIACGDNFRASGVARAGQQAIAVDDMGRVARIEAGRCTVETTLRGSDGSAVWLAHVAGSPDGRARIVTMVGAVFRREQSDGAFTDWPAARPVGRVTFTSHGFVYLSDTCELGVEADGGIRFRQIPSRTACEAIGQDAAGALWLLAAGRVMKLAWDDLHTNEVAESPEPQENLVDATRFAGEEFALTSPDRRVRRRRRGGDRWEGGVTGEDRGGATFLGSSTARVVWVTPGPNRVGTTVWNWQSPQRHWFVNVPECQANQDLRVALDATRDTLLLFCKSQVEPGKNKIEVVRIDGGWRVPTSTSQALQDGEFVVRAGARDGVGVAITSFGRVVKFESEMRTVPTPMAAETRALQREFGNTTPAYLWVGRDGAFAAGTTEPRVLWCGAGDCRTEWLRGGHRTTLHSVSGTADGSSLVALAANDLQSELYVWPEGATPHELTVEPRLAVRARCRGITLDERDVYCVGDGGLLMRFPLARTVAPHHIVAVTSGIALFVLVSAVALVLHLRGKSAVVAPPVPRGPTHRYDHLVRIDPADLPDVCWDEAVTVCVRERIDLRLCDGATRRAVESALLRAFPTYDSLQRLVQFAINEPLTESAQVDVDIVVSRMMTRAISGGWASQLVDAAVDERPGNLEVAELVIRPLPPGAHLDAGKVLEALMKLLEAHPPRLKLSGFIRGVQAIVHGNTVPAEQRSANDPAVLLLLRVDQKSKTVQVRRSLDPHAAPAVNSSAKTPSHAVARPATTEAASPIIIGVLSPADSA